jgi:ribosomal 50S subunit-recycling heat shock protein
MRLDKYLKVSRLIKRRSVASDAVSGQRVTVNGRAVKPAHTVKVGDVIEIQFGARKLTVEVTELRETAGKDDAPSLYREIAP